MTLQLGVVLHRAVVTARHDDELRCAAGEPRQLARVRDRHALVALGVQEQQRQREPLDRGVQRVLGRNASSDGTSAGKSNSPPRSPRDRPSALAGQIATAARAPRCSAARIAR